MFINLPRPIIFAHRGASAHAPENTLAAFELAIQQHADVIELDAKLTADQHVVVIHDQTIDRTTGESGRVNDLPLSLVRQLDAGSHFDIAFKGEPIPTLEEVLESVGHRILINIELTNYASILDALPEKVTQLVERIGLSQRVLFSSFNAIALRRIHQLIPVAPIGLLAKRGMRGILARSWIGRRVVPYQALHPEFNDITEDLVTACHKEEKRVHVYTVNMREDILRLITYNVDGIFTDDPILARQVILTSNCLQ